jgi:hypothetical protein
MTTKAGRRYFGPEQGDGWVQPMRSMVDGMAQITIEPREVRILDFEARFPSAIAP